MFVSKNKAMAAMCCQSIRGNKPGDKVKILRPKRDRWSRFVRWLGIGIYLEEVEVTIVKSFDSRTDF